jgi:hypothetical protein
MDTFYEFSFDKSFFDGFSFDGFLFDGFSFDGFSFDELPWSQKNFILHVSNILQLAGVVSIFFVDQKIVLILKNVQHDFYRNSTLTRVTRLGEISPFGE